MHLCPVVKPALFIYFSTTRAHQCITLWGIGLCNIEWQEKRCRQMQRYKCEYIKAFQNKGTKVNSKPEKNKNTWHDKTWLEKSSFFSKRTTIIKHFLPWRWLCKAASNEDRSSSFYIMAGSWSRMLMFIGVRHIAFRRNTWVRIEVLIKAPIGASHFGIGLPFDMAPEKKVSPAMHVCLVVKPTLKGPSVQQSGLF